MSLQVWLPLNGDTKNQGLASLPNSSVNTITFDDNGKIGKCSKGRIAWHLTEEILGNQWSVATWVKSTATFGVNNNIIFCKNNTSSTDCQIYFSIINGTVLHVGVNGPSSGLSVAQTFSLNTWYHVAATYDGTTVSLYINGELKKTGTVTTAMPTGRLNMNLNGRSTNAANTSATGQLDPGYYFNDFRLYDHALLQKEVKELSKALVFHLKLDNSSFGAKNLIPDSVYKSDPWKTAIAETLDLDGRSAIRVSPGVLYTKTSNGSTELFPGLTYEENTQYTFSIDWRDDYRTDNKITNLYIRFEYSDGTTSNLISGDLREKHYWTHSHLTSTAGKTVVKMRTTYGNDGYIYLANLKLEKGTKDTGWAPYDEPDIYDCSGYNHKAELEGTTEYNRDSARYSNSLDFKGTGCIKSVPFYYDSNIWSVCFWYYEPLSPTSYEGLFSFSKGDGSDANKKIAAMPNNGYIWYKGESGSKSVYSLKIAEWTFLTMTCDGTTVKIYQNATQVDSFSAGTALTGREDLVIGKRAASSGAATTAIPYKGRMSDFRMYATCLSDGDILELYQTTASGDRRGNFYARECHEVDVFDNIKELRNGCTEGEEFAEHTNNLVSMKKTGSINSYYLYEY